jgi:hypothetical protein
MEKIVNWELLREPMNWLIVALMLAIAAFGLHLVMSGGAGWQSATGSTGQ